MRTPRTSPHLAWIVALCLPGTTILRAQVRTPDAYGTKNLAYASFPATAFSTLLPSTVWVYDADRFRFSTSANPCFVAPVQMPSGVNIRFLSIEGCDMSATDDLYGILLDCPQHDPCSVAASVMSSGAPGCTNFGSSLVDVDILNLSHSYSLQVCNFSSSNLTKFRNVTLAYQLQISPAPATATFADVPTTHLYFRAIEALAAAGITSGCGAGNFCPDQAVTRGEVAKFLANALGLSWSP